MKQNACFLSLGSKQAYEVRGLYLVDGHQAILEATLEFLIVFVSLV